MCVCSINKESILLLKSNNHQATPVISCHFDHLITRYSDLSDASFVILKKKISEKCEFFALIKHFFLMEKKYHSNLAIA